MLRSGSRQLNVRMITTAQMMHWDRMVTGFILFFTENPPFAQKMPEPVSFWAALLAPMISRKLITDFISPTAVPMLY